MAYTTIDDPSVYFQTALWSGDDATTQNITNDGNSDLQPDWVWVKCRNTSGNGFDHTVWDTSRGVDNNLNKSISPSQNDSQGLGANVTTTAQLGGVSAMLSDGFTVREGSVDNDSRYVNENSRTYVGWQWKANGGSRTTFTESGNNPGGGYQANTTAGFSIVDYTGTGALGTLAHGLGVAPTVLLVKGLSDNHAWIVKHSGAGNPVLILNATDAASSGSSEFNNTAPTSSVFTVNSAGGVNNDGQNYIAYCFAPIQGYSDFGKYTGQENANGPFVYTGFKPAWIMIKQTDQARDWLILDNKREPSNDSSRLRLKANSDGADDDSADNAVDFLSNGFKIRTGSNGLNANTGNFVYLAFAENPFVSSEGVAVPAG